MVKDKEKQDSRCRKLKSRELPILVGKNCSAFIYTFGKLLTVKTPLPKKLFASRALCSRGWNSSRLFMWLAGVLHSLGADLHLVLRMWLISNFS